MILLAGLSMHAQDERIRLGIQAFRRRSGVVWRLVDAGHDWRDLDWVLKRHRPVGAIAHVLDAETVDRLRALGLPVVALDSGPAEEAFPCITLHHRAAGRMAAEHLLDRGLRRLVVYATTDWTHERERVKGFRERLEGEDVEVLHVQS